MRSRTHLSLGMTDQVLLSAGSLLVLVLAARGYSAAELGTFSAGILTSQALVVVSRAATGETVVVLPRGTSHGLGPSRERDCVRFAATVPLAGAAVGLLALLSGHEVLMVVGAGLVVLPGLAVQDTLRYVLLRQRRTHLALGNDLLVVVGQVLAVLLGVRAGLPPWTVVLLVGVPPALVAVVRCATARTGISWAGARRWRKASRGLSDTYVFEAVLGAAVVWATFAAVVAFASLADAGAFRTITAIYGVTTVVTNYLRSSFLAQLVHQGPVDRRRAVGNATIMTAQVFVAMAASYVALILISDGLGTQLFGDTWETTRTLLLLGALSRTAAALTTVPAVLLRALQVTWEAARIRTAVGVLTVVVAPVGVVLDGVGGALVASTVMSAVMVLLLARTVALTTRTNRTMSDDEQGSNGGAQASAVDGGGGGPAAPAATGAAGEAVVPIRGAGRPVVGSGG